MTTFTQFSETIERLLRGARCVRITVEGYMPLVAEEIGASAEGRRLVALAHTGVQNGDVMHDPEIVFEFHALGRRTGVYAKRRAELVSFTRVWFRNIRAQGFFGEGARREVIA
jgi:hypothetical protein